MSTAASQDTQRTRTEAILDNHNDDWTVGDGETGLCGCGLALTSEDQWQEHAQQVLIDELFSPTAQVVTTPAELAALPERSVIVARPSKESMVFRRIVLGNPDMNYWCNLTGTFRHTTALLPALLLERGPVAT